MVEQKMLGIYKGLLARSLPQSPICVLPERAVAIRLQKVQLEEFQGLLLESIDGATCAVLGEIPRQALFSSLEENFGIRREDIPRRMEDFQKAFSAVFGKVAPVMTRVIVRNLCDKLRIPYHETKDWDLKTHVDDCRRRYGQEKEL